MVKYSGRERAREKSTEGLETAMVNKSIGRGGDVQ